MIGENSWTEGGEAPDVTVENDYDWDYPERARPRAPSKPLTGKKRLEANRKKKLRQREVRDNYTEEEREVERTKNRLRMRESRKKA